MTDESTEQRLVIRTPIAPLMAEPGVSCPQISQLLAGRVVVQLETRDDWYFVRGPDAYEGWLHRGYVTPAFNSDAKHNVQLGRVSLGCTITSACGMKRAMPLGAGLGAEEQVNSGDAIDVAHQSELFPSEAAAITRSAQRYFEGTSYLWGGVTPWGADCSGLVQATYWLHGIQLRRDAWQQAEQGAPGESNIMDAHAADLLFFSDRTDERITHVAIALGGGCLVHLALGRGGYAVERLDGSRDPYVAKLIARFVTARRILTPTLAAS